ncbi:uncharacterized protein [Ptychodera flava]|uniref:uncharacterized protein n=1 Tax=Ptychodera flava TaxID=63121 RepID=UPI00396A9AB8
MNTERKPPWRRTTNHLIFVSIIVVAIIFTYGYMRLRIFHVPPIDWQAGRGTGETAVEVNSTDHHTSREHANKSTPLRAHFSAQLLDKLGDLRDGFTGTLKPHEKPVVPNIAHYIWFSCHPFEFENLLSLISVHRFMRAEKILFHTDCEPSGQWWKEARKIPSLEILQREPVKTIFGRNINPIWPEHQSDVARLQILMEYGGIYFDTDIFVLKSLEPLRYYDYVVGRQTSDGLNNGIILASKDSEFLRVFYESYRNYKPSCYSCISIKYHNDLAKEHQHLVHIENYSLVQPNFDKWRTIFYGKFDWPDNHYTIHLWIKQYKNKHKGFSFNSENIKSLDTAFGEMCRYIYYGTSDLIQTNATELFEWWSNATS